MIPMMVTNNVSAARIIVMISKAVTRVTPCATDFRRNGALWKQRAFNLPLARGLKPPTVL